MAGDVSPLYLKLIQTADARRVALGISLETWSDLAGVADRYANKLVRPTPHGMVGSKVPQYRTLDELLAALYGPGYRVKVVPGPDRPKRQSRPPRQLDLFPAP